MAVDVAYSRMLSEHFSAAVALRYIYSDLAYREDEDVSAGSAFAADIAFYYTNYVILAQRECMLSFGLNASNIGTKISYDSGNTSQFLPGLLLADEKGDDFSSVGFPSASGVPVGVMILLKCLPSPGCRAAAFTAASSPMQSLANCTSTPNNSSRCFRMCLQIN